jgi:hypothetical protein
VSTTSEPAAFLYLSQIPYTGLDLGPIGTTLYWLALIAWSLALAYLLLFGAAPFAARKVRNFAYQVSEVVNAPVFVEDEKEETLPALLTKEPERGYSTFDGFRSFAKDNALTIEDIVKGLSRTRENVEPIYDNVEPIYDKVEPLYDNVEPVTQQGYESVSGRSNPPMDAPRDVRGFCAALVEGDRPAVFAALRMQVKGGDAPEMFVTRIACALDDAYRARVDGTPADAEIVRIVARLDTNTLERLVSALSNAIDASYSTGITGAKLALTRALSALGA